LRDMAQEISADIVIAKHRLKVISGQANHAA
jgi:hypothetical protein